MPSTIFIVKLKDINIGLLTYNEFRQKREGHKIWDFCYTEEFKKLQGNHALIMNFQDLHKIYFSHELWPFFKIRIPGLKQPAIMEILDDEEIKKDDECALLKRFGNKCISNPYVLEALI